MHILACIEETKLREEQGQQKSTARVEGRIRSVCRNVFLSTAPCARPSAQATWMLLPALPPKQVSKNVKANLDFISGTGLHSSRSTAREGRQYSGRCFLCPRGHLSCCRSSCGSGRSQKGAPPSFRVCQVNPVTRCPDHSLLQAAPGRQTSVHSSQSPSC